jgi:hypothetical protein
VSIARRLLIADVSLADAAAGTVDPYLWPPEADARSIK